jgi:hypothetical protein
MRRYLALAFSALFLTSCGSDQPDSPMWHDVMKSLDKSRPLISGPMGCKFSNARICSEIECEDGPNGVDVSWNPSSGQYRRCDKNGCDVYKPVASMSGTYTVLSFPENGMLAKISNRGDIVEVATMMNTAFVKHGQCSSKTSKADQSSEGRPFLKIIDGKPTTK